MLALLLAPAGARADQNDPRLDGLFARLQTTVDEVEAAGIEARIARIWGETGDSDTDQLMRGGEEAVAQQNWPAAMAAFNTVLDQRPDLAEAWNMRAMILYAAARPDEAARDAERALALDPRHFGALSGRGLIELDRNDPAEALIWFRKALAVNPYMPELRALVDRMAAERELRIE